MCGIVFCPVDYPSADMLCSPWGLNKPRYRLTCATGVTVRRLLALNEDVSHSDVAADSTTGRLTDVDKLGQF